MLESFEYIFTAIYNFFGVAVSGLNNVLIEKANLDMKQMTLDIKILSDTPILSTTLYDLLVLFVMIVGTILIVKLFKKIISLPFKLWKR